MSRMRDKWPVPIANPTPFPEIFFRLQPDISAACDEWENKGIRRPTQEEFNLMVERIHDSACNRYPDLARQAEEYGKESAFGHNEALELFDVQIQQRGFFRGLIAFLLLRELIRRRRKRRRH
jgi:hypothetical protein